MIYHAVMSEFALNMDEEGGECFVDQEADADVAMSGTSNFLSSVELEDLLKKKKYEDFKKKLNLPTNLEDTDDLEVLVRLSDNGLNKTGCKLLNKNLFNFICCLAGLSLDTTGMSAVDQYTNYDIKFTYWLRDIHLSRNINIIVIK